MNAAVLQKRDGLCDNSLVSIIVLLLWPIPFIECGHVQALRSDTFDPLTGTLLKKRFYH